MPPTSFRIVHHGLGFWESFGGQAFDVVGDGEQHPYVAIKVNRIHNLLSSGLTFKIVGPDGQPQATYIGGPMARLSHINIDWCSTIVKNDDSAQRLCLNANADRSQIDAIERETSDVTCPVVLNVVHGPDHEMLLARPKRHLAELHHPWRDSEIKAGVMGRFTIASDLNENLYRVAVLSAAAETIAQLDKRQP